MPEYALFLRDDQVMQGDPSREDQAAQLQKYRRWTDKLKREGRLRAVQRLEGNEARRVRRRGGRPADELVVEGPFDPVEPVQGFYIVEADDWEEATRIGMECPCVDSGGNVEVRLLAPPPASLPD